MNNQSFDILALIGILLALLNLDENQGQSEMLNEHLHEQDGKYLKKIIDQNNEILKLLGGK